MLQSAVILLRGTAFKHRVDCRANTVSSHLRRHSN